MLTITVYLPIRQGSVNGNENLGSTYNLRTNCTSGAPASHGKASDGTRIAKVRNGILACGGWFSWVNYDMECKKFDPSINTWTGIANLNRGRLCFIR